MGSSTWFTVTVYGNVNSIKFLRRKQAQYFIPTFLMSMQSNLLLNVDSTTTLFSLRTRQLKAEPLNNMLRNVFWSPGSSKWDAFFYSTTLLVVTMNCPSQIMILIKAEHKFLNLQLVKCIIVMHCVTSHDYASQLHMLSWAHGRLRVSYLFVPWIAQVTRTLHLATRKQGHPATVST